MNDFPAIRLLAHRPYDRIRELYLVQEPALMAAIRRGDRGEARRIINYVLSIFTVRGKNGATC